MMNIFKPDYEQYEGVRRINIYVMRVFFFLMFFFMGFSSWSHILTHKGSWEPTNAVAWCTWAAYSFLSLFGIYHTLRMLPIMLFMVFYKSLWLIVVAYPLWAANQLKGSAAEELTNIFIWVLIPLAFIPWKYVFKKYILFSFSGK
ncbi:MAG: hypothetical protein HYX40_04500 [Sphingobacteriales bacterium]|nr:hypothetical protein [Sphingobacteriales bacterium]